MKTTSPTMTQRKQQTSLDPSRPLVIDTRELGRRPGTARLALEPLGTDAIASLIGSRPSVRADGSLAQQIRDRTGGNALFAVEIGFNYR